MTTAATALPLLGLRITAGPVELRGMTDDLLGPLADLAINGIHAPDLMPFSTPWSIAPPEEIPRNTAEFHWGPRSIFSPAKWGMALAVLFDGQLVGSQGFSTRDFLITRIGETGSWLRPGIHRRRLRPPLREGVR